VPRVEPRPAPRQDPGRGGDRGGSSPSFPPVFGGSRIERTSERSSQDRDPVTIGRRKVQSRSGEVRYGSTNNFGVRGRIERPTIGQFPSDFNNREINRRVMQQERVGLVHGGVRYGYYHYDRNWRDDYFYYPYYAFDPFGYNRCVASPWYYYPTLPPYINGTRVTIININALPYVNWVGQSYRWNRPDRSDRWTRYNDIDYTLDDLVVAFERGENRAINRLIPRNGQVHVYMDGRYNYSLGPDDFYDLFNDGIQSTRTRDYQILDVQTSNRDVARVYARHEYDDPWGRRTTVFHSFTLERERNDYVIREFGVSNHRSW